LRRKQQLEEYFSVKIKISGRIPLTMTDIKIPTNTLRELRGVLVRALSRENLSMDDKIAIRKSQSYSSLKIHYTWNSTYGGKEPYGGFDSDLCAHGADETFHACRRSRSVFIQMWCGLSVKLFGST
jgi:hypothetical protein